MYGGVGMSVYTLFFTVHMGRVYINEDPNFILKTDMHHPRYIFGYVLSKFSVGASSLIDIKV